MTETIEHKGQQRHLWLEVLEASPQDSVADLMAGYASVFPYTRADAPDAVRMLVGHLPDNDPAREALASGMSSWLHAKRAEPLPSDPARLQDFVRQVTEAFEIISLIELTEPAVELREQYVRWFDWASRLNLAPSRDGRASYLRMIANTQTIVAEHISEPDGLAPFWIRMCKESGSTYPARYLQIGLLGLRRLPGEIERGGSPWIAGLAAWARAQNPSGKEFMRTWRPIKRLHPASLRTMRQRVFNVLSQKSFVDADIQSPGWWASDPDFPKSQDSKGRANSLEPPAAALRESIIDDIRANATFSDLRKRLTSLVVAHERYADATGDDYFLVRSFCNIGTNLVKHSVDDHVDRAQFAERLARKTLRYQPYNPIAWGLWREALLSAGAQDAAIALGWESVRRFPNEPLMRTELAEILIALERPNEALSLIEGALEAGTCDVVTYSILVRLLANRGDIGEARSAIDDGLMIDDGDEFLLEFRTRLDKGAPLQLVANARLKVKDVTGASVKIHDPTILEFERIGKLRSLRQRLKNDVAAIEELKNILNSDPTFAYAQILAARHKLWHASEQVLPPVAAAFEEALASEDIERLSALTEKMPRLESLILLARAILGDAAAAKEVVSRLRNPTDADDEQAVNILRDRFQPVLELINGGLEPADAVNSCVDQLRIAIYDTNEALSTPELMVA